MSPKIERLRHSIQRSSNLVERDILKVRLCCLQVREGSFSDATELLRSLRRKYASGEHGRPLVWLNLLEGMMALYGRVDESALALFSRAQALARFISDDLLLSIASAWRAHVEFELSEFPAMLESIQIATQAASREDAEPWARIGIVVFNSIILTGNRSEAQRWFSFAHEHAVRDGDQLSIDALLYNRVAFGLALHRFNWCCGIKNQQELALLQLEMESSERLRALIGSKTFAGHVGALRAGFSILAGDHQAALDRFAETPAITPGANHNMPPELLELERAYCHFHIGQPNRALEIVSKIDSARLATLDSDELVYAKYLRLDLANSDTRFGEAERLKTELEAAILRYREIVSDLSEGVERAQLGRFLRQQRQ